MSLWCCVLRDTPWGVHLVPTQQQSGAETDVAVRIRAVVVQVRIEHACIRPVVPVATTIRRPL